MASEQDPTSMIDRLVDWNETHGEMLEDQAEWIKQLIKRVGVLEAILIKKELTTQEELDETLKEFEAALAVDAVFDPEYQRLDEKEEEEKEEG